MPCYRTPMKSGGYAFICGNLGDHCAASECSDVSDYLCDYPVGEGKTCDLPVCQSHAYEVATNIHYCPSHLELWVKFSGSGGAEKALKNVEAFNTSAFDTKLKKLEQENQNLKNRINYLEKPKPIK
jgi:hypothetical protein